MSVRRATAALVACALLACSAPPALVGCDPGEGITPVCNFRHPEDLARLAETDWFAVSQAADDAAPGSLVAWRPGDDAVRDLWPGGVVAADPRWGDPACPGPPDAAAFYPHGIDDGRRPDGVPLLLAVNHGGRESVELFEVGSADGTPSLLWRGCVMLPADGFANDLAALPDGRGFVATRMAARDEITGFSLGITVKTLLGRPTGFVYEWTDAGGWRRIPGSEGSLPNGVEVSADGARVFVAMFNSASVRAVGRDGSDPRDVDVGIAPDNLTWSPDGRLLAAGATGSTLTVLGCRRAHPAACGIPWAVVAIDPDTLEARPVLEHDGGVFGVISVALPAGARLLLGSFQGDRVAHTPLPTP